MEPVSNSAQTVQPVSHEPSQSGSTPEIDDITQCLNEISELTYDSFFDNFGPPVIVLSKEEFKSEPIQQWISSGNVDPSRVVCYSSHERQGLQDKSFSQWDLSDGEDVDEETPVLDLREYQKELAETALLGQNTIICAPTGAGKTRVAVHIILNHLQQQQADEKNYRKVVFFARTVPLVHQQYRVLKKFLPKKYKVTSLTGENKHSLHLDLIIPEYDVIVMTPRILENHFIRNPQDHVDKFSMMVFDECHHAHKEEPYNTLMLYYLKRKQLIKKSRARGEMLEAKLPQIVGLTATIGVGNATDESKAKDYMLTICGNLDVRHVSSVVRHIEELKQRNPVCDEELVTLVERDVDDAVSKILEKMKKQFEVKIVELSKKLKMPDLETLLKSKPENYKSIQYGHWTVHVKKAAKSLPRTESLEKNGWKRFLIILADYLSTYNVALELHDLVLLRHVMEYLNQCFEQYRESKNCTQDEYSYFESFSELEEQLKDKLDAENPNLSRLKKCLLKHIVMKGEASRGIIFVRTRALARALTFWLNKCGDSQIEDLKAKVFTGTSAPAAKGGMTTAQQTTAIQHFESGQARILVATSVAEEGIDIPECNLVIKYNYVGNEITYLQAKGRSRKRGGVSVILAMSKIIEKEKLNKKKAELMEKALKLLLQMDSAEIKKQIEAHQLKVMRDEETVEAMRQVMKKRMYKKHFKMACHKCGDVVIDSDDIRTICNMHRVVINRKILTQTKTQIEEKVVSFDDTRLVGPANCMGRLSGGNRCNSKIGSLMIFSNIPFIVLGLKRFGFETDDRSCPQNFKNWKDVPFIVDEIGPQDYQRYLPELSDMPTNDDDDSSDELNKTLEETDFDEQNGETSSSSLQSNATLSTKADDAIEETKVQLSQDSGISEEEGVKVTKNPNSFQQSSSSDVSTGMIKKVRYDDIASEKTLKDTDAHQRHSTEVPSHTSMDSQSNIGELDCVERFTRILTDAPSLRTDFSSTGQPILSVEPSSPLMSLESSTSNEGS